MYHTKKAGHYLVFTAYKHLGRTNDIFTKGNANKKLDTFQNGQAQANNHIKSPSIDLIKKRCSQASNNVDKQLETILLQYLTTPLVLHGAPCSVYVGLTQGRIFIFFKGGVGNFLVGCKNLSSKPGDTDSPAKLNVLFF
jgi:hypothetical protein